MPLHWHPGPLETQGSPPFPPTLQTPEGGSSHFPRPQASLHSLAHLLAHPLFQGHIDPPIHLCIPSHKLTPSHTSTPPLIHLFIDVLADTQPRTHMCQHQSREEPKAGLEWFLCSCLLGAHRMGKRQTQSAERRVMTEQHCGEDFESRNRTGFQLLQDGLDTESTVFLPKRRASGRGRQAEEMVKRPTHLLAFGRGYTRGRGRNRYILNLIITQRAEGVRNHFT